MFVLGFIQQLTGLITGDALCEIISKNVPARYMELNQTAARSGMALAKEMDVKVEA
jgi:Pyruvate/2-oxoacid:ferredoxin oxidoreductase gamma subunit